MIVFAGSILRILDVDGGPAMINRLLSIPFDQMSYDWLIGLLTALESATGVTESPWIEVKVQRQRNNIAEAVGALANADGGLVLVGVKDDKTALAATDRVVGVPRQEHEGITTSLLASLADSMPEIHTVAVPNSDRIVVVLRVDAEAVLHPVVVGGRVKVRIGSTTLNADRDLISRLFARDEGGGRSGRLAMPSLGINAEAMPFWPDEYEPAMTARLYRVVNLPESILERPWLPSVTVSAARAVLDASVLDGRVWLRGGLVNRAVRNPRAWHLDARRASDFRLSTDPGTDTDWPDDAIGGGAFVGLDARALKIVLAATLPPSDGARSLRLDEVHWLLLALLITHLSLTSAIVDALGVSGPVRTSGWTGWLQPSSNAAPIDEVIDLSQWARASTGGVGTRLLPTYETLDDEPATLDRLVREWLVLLLADSGVLDHEEDVERLGRPHWPPYR